MFEFFEVGGCVRDSLLGINSKDVDFSVVAKEGAFDDVHVAFSALENYLLEHEFKIFESRPEFLTIRARVGADHPLRERTDVADFVLARRDGPYLDGRRPAWVKPGSLLDDLSRRDFRGNAIARDMGGNLIDPFGGVSDVENKVLRFVGNPTDRIQEDGLRVLRGLRFQITKGFSPTLETWEALTSPLAVHSLRKVSKERVREELNKMFCSSTLNTLALLQSLPQELVEVIFDSGLRLEATLKSGRK